MRTTTWSTRICSSGRIALRGAVLADARKVPNLVDHFAVAYAIAAMPARMALERGDWKEAANLPLYPAADAYPWKKYPQSEAVNAFARGIGAAMSKDPAAAHVEVKRLHALRDAAAALKIGYWVEQIDIQADVVSGLAAYAEGKQADGIEILSKAAAREDATEKHVVTPGLLVPAREVLAQALLASGKPADALREFEAVLVKEPNRYRAFAGAAQAAERAGDAKKAAFYSARLVEMTGSPTARCPRSRKRSVSWACSRGARSMRERRRWVAGLAGAFMTLASLAAGAVESDPLPVPKGTPREQAIRAYNDGVTLMLEKRYVAAQARFEDALGRFEGLAEAHNNLAFSLRMQGAHNFDRALAHYNRALELKPDLAQAYMYRGVLFTQMGDLKRASADHAKLLRLDRALAAKLEASILGRVANDGREGLAAQYE